jgi:hypothetical protein
MRMGTFTGPGQGVPGIISGGAGLGDGEGVGAGVGLAVGEGVGLGEAVAVGESVGGGALSPIVPQAVSKATAIRARQGPARPLLLFGLRWRMELGWVIFAGGINICRVEGTWA